MAEPILRCEHVTKRFGGTIAVDDVSLALPPGQLTSLIGPNGSGKTTLVNLIAGTLRPDAGSIEWQDRRLTGPVDRVARQGLGRLHQEVRVFGSLTVLENVTTAVPGQSGEGLGMALLARRRVGRETRAARETARECLARVGLSDDFARPAGRLSYGQQKLVAIARLLAAEARLLLLDEPASGVNPRLTEHMAALFGDLVAEGRTLLLVEHNLTLVRQVSDQVILLAEGRCRAAGPAEEVWRLPVLDEVYLPAP